MQWECGIFCFSISPALTWDRQETVLYTVSIAPDGNNCNEIIRLWQRGHDCTQGFNRCAGRADFVELTTLKNLSEVHIIINESCDVAQSQNAVGKMQKTTTSTCCAKFHRIRTHDNVFRDAICYRFHCWSKRRKKSVRACQANKDPLLHRNHRRRRGGRSKRGRTRGRVVTLPPLGHGGGQENIQRRVKMGKGRPVVEGIKGCNHSRKLESSAEI